MTRFPSTQTTFARQAAAVVFGCIALLHAACAMARPAEPFGFEDVARIAQELSTRPARANSDNANTNPAAPALPAELRDMTYDQHRDIRFKPEQALWRGAGLPFEAMFFHRGPYQAEPVQVNEIDADGTVRHLAYDASRFDYGRNTFNPQSWGDLGYAGLRLHYPLNSAGYKDELAVFQGASYFRGLGAGQGYGLSARGLAIDTVGGTAEEFPRFSTFWLQKPVADAKQATVFALLESARATGAYRFDIEPGSQTRMLVQARLFLRAGNTADARPIATLGIAPLTSMFFSGENQPAAGDFRPEVHDSDGLMVETGEGEWLWRPLQNPARTTVMSFATTNPRGFGLMQRDRKFTSYEDGEARYERRPSAWIRPQGDWGAGRVELVLLKAPDETHDNVVSYWVPAKLPEAGVPFDFSYSIEWQGDAPQQPPNGHVVQTRRGIGFNRLDAATLRSQVQYVVDFAGPSLDTLPADAPVRAVASSDANGRIAESLVYRNAATGAWRMTLRVQRTNLSQPVELRAHLQNINQTVSETWTNTIIPE